MNPIGQLAALPRLAPQVAELAGGQPVDDLPQAAIGRDRPPNPVLVLGAQVDRLRDEFGVYLIASGRMCVAGLNANNVQRVAQAFAAVFAAVFHTICVFGHRPGYEEQICRGC